MAESARRRAELGGLGGVQKGKRVGSTVNSGGSVGDLAAAAAASARRRAERTKALEEEKQEKKTEGNGEAEKRGKVTAMENSEFENGGNLRVGGYKSVGELERAIKERQASLRKVGIGEGRTGGEDEKKGKKVASVPWENLLKKGMDRIRLSQSKEEENDTMEW